MGTGGIYFYKLVSEYPNDVTKNCRLSVNEIDSNFKVLKDADIDTAEYDEASRVLVLTRNNGEKLIVDLGNVTYNLHVEKIEDENGVTLNISYNDKDGDHFVSLEHVITKENLMEFVEGNVLTRVITDNTLKGNGTVWSPLGLNGVEKTGNLAPAKSIIDLTSGGSLPSVSKLGTRYVTLENVHDYGMLYSKKGVDKISQRLEAEGKGWRVPSKADWDALLNSIEPCEYRNHDLLKCHVELGKFAGKFLKSECGWEGQLPCDCNGDKPVTCFTPSDICDTAETAANEEEWGPSGVDKYGMTIRPCGEAHFDNLGNDVYHGFGTESVMWTTTHVCDDPDQDLYAKAFLYNKGGVVQEAQCPDNFYSVRLVKDYDGENYFDTEYIDGIPYKTVLFPQSKQVWIAANFASTEGFIGVDDVRNGDLANCVDAVTTKDVEYLEVNGGEGIETRKAYFINEWNGEYWDKKMLSMGMTIVIEDSSCGESGETVTKTVCWLDENKEEHCMEVEIPSVEQTNIEYRVYNDDECNQVLVNTDDLAVERLVSILIPILGQERAERIAADEALNQRIDEEISARTEVERQIWEAINEEASARTEVDNQQWAAIAEEANARQDVDNQQWAAISAESEARQQVESQLWDAINTETTNREDVDSQLWDAINTEVTDRNSVDAQMWEAINNEMTTREMIDNQQWDAINAEIERAKAEEERIEGLTIVPMEEPYEMKVAVEEGENLVLETRDGNEENFIRILLDGNFGEI